MTQSFLQDSISKWHHIVGLGFNSWVSREPSSVYRSNWLNIVEPVKKV